MSDGPAADPCSLGVAELRDAYDRGDLGPVELTEATLERISRLNPSLNVYLEVFADQARSAARAAEAQLDAGIDLGPLQGVPVSLKDIIDVRGSHTTAGSRVLGDAAVARDDAPVVRRLRAGGAIVLGKVNLAEFAMGEPDEDGPGGYVQNPRRVGYQSGSSSSGSAACVAAGLATLSVGSQTGGSVLHPASVCGTVGLKPTFGRVPKRGVVPVSGVLDHVGLLGRTVADVAAGLEVVAGHDPDDPHSRLVAVDRYRMAGSSTSRGLRLGVPTNDVFDLGIPVARELRRRAVELLASRGLDTVAMELPRAHEIGDILETIVSADLAAYHERYRDREHLYQSDLRARLERGRRVEGPAYAAARHDQLDVTRSWEASFSGLDVVILPANGAGAPPHGQDTIELDGSSYPVRKVNSYFNRAGSLTGFPTITVPAGATDEGLPLGVQLMAAPFQERTLLRVAVELEAALGDLTERWGIEPREPDVRAHAAR